MGRPLFTFRVYESGQHILGSPFHLQTLRASSQRHRWSQVHPRRMACTSASATPHHRASTGAGAAELNEKTKKEKKTWRFFSDHQLLLLQRGWAGQHFTVSQWSTGSKTKKEVTQPTENSTCVFAHSQRAPALTDLDQPLCTEQAEEGEGSAGNLP